MSAKKSITAIALAAAVAASAVGITHAHSSSPRLRADFGWDVVVSPPPATN